MGWRWLVVTAMAVSLVGCGDRAARQDRAQAVEKTFRAFYEAYAQGDLAAMGQVWSAEPYVRCQHPSGPLLVGSQAVQQGWQAALAGVGPRTIEPHQPQFQIGIDMAWVAAKYTVRSRRADGQEEIAYLWGIDIFEEKRPGVWKIVYHQAVWETL
ncbi:MAG: nuclear transport factor 2 family protein [Thermodesulfobacteriota bacterium]